MAYFTPYLDGTGYHFPSYNDIVARSTGQYRDIYGQDVYLENDSQDYQWISVRDLDSFDFLQMLQVVLDGYSVKTASGTQLDNLVQLNGIRRKPASYSTVQLTLTGTIGTVILRGAAADVNGNQWFIDDEETVLDVSPKTVSATCGVIGEIQAPEGTIRRIVNPTSGWISVNNESRAIPGAPVETDAELRVRQAYSVALPSRNMLQSLYAGLMSLNNVQDVMIYENDTSVTDRNGIPGHTVSCVVIGGADDEIAQVIYNGKGPGCGTYGTTQINVSNPDSGLPTLISFFRPSETSVDVELNISVNTNFTSLTEQAIRNAVSDYFAGIEMGTDILRNSIVAAVNRKEVIADLYRPEFVVNSVRTAVSGEPLANADTEIVFNCRAILGSLTLIGVPQ